MSALGFHDEGAVGHGVAGNLLQRRERGVLAVEQLLRLAAAVQRDMAPVELGCLAQRLVVEVCRHQVGDDGLRAGEELRRQVGDARGNLHDVLLLANRGNRVKIITYKYIKVNIFNLQGYK